MRDFLRILIIYLAHNQGIILQQGIDIALVGMNYGADGNYFKVYKWMILMLQRPPFKNK